MAIIFAFCCLGFASANDFVFKLFARKMRSRGLFVFIIGLVWMLLAMLLPDKAGKSWEITLKWGLISGVFSVLSNILLIEAMSWQSAGLCSTIFRLNLALVVPGAALLFGEKHAFYQYIGVACALLAVMLFLPGKAERSSADKNSYLGIILVICAAVLRAGMGLTYKYAFNLGASSNGIALSNSFCWIIFGVIYFLLRERDRRSDVVSGKLWGYGALSGVLVVGIVYFMAHSLRLGDAGIVLPIMQMSFILTAFLGVFILREKLSFKKYLALAGGAAALILLSI